MQDQYPSDGVPPKGRDAPQSPFRAQRSLAASIEQDFRALLDRLRLYQSIAEPAVAAHLERVNAAVERGIELSLRLKKTTESDC